MSTKPIQVAPAATLQNVIFDDTMEAQIAEVLEHYPSSRAALLPVLWMCQQRYGWISAGVMEAVAGRLGEAPAFVEGVVRFYTMFYTQPPARYVVQVCETLSCAVCGGRELVEHLENRLGIKPGGKTEDGMFQMIGVQCLGACGYAPVVQINDDYYENLTPEKLDAVLDQLKEQG